MRIVAWNVNYNNKRRSFEDVMRMMDPLHADILVLSEIACPESGGNILTVRANQTLPGITVVSHNGLRLEPHAANADAPPLVGAFTVSGRINFELVAAWPVKLDGGDSYHHVLMKSLKLFHEVLGSENSILAGDLNSSTGVSGQQSSHPKFIEEARKLGIASIYHEQTGEDFGRETANTYSHGGAKEFHIDYCFASQRLRPAANISILRGGEWSTRSDHFPVVVDIPDIAFA